ncbi:MAG: hypothetical protein AYK18_07070 [Theionarchaea archaeon DG-70]|nr:MAG: hypothetical protein AYK18_07070 [Theionarchaea archaeon DG-70]
MKFKPKYLIYIGLAVFWWWKNGKMGFVQMDKAFFIAIWVGFLTLFSEHLYGTWKHHSPRFACPNLHNSVSMNIDTAGNHVIFTLGGVKTDFVMEGKEGTVVLPRELTFIGKDVIISHVVLKEVDLNGLDPDAHDFIRERTSKFKPPYYTGYFTVEEWNQIPRTTEEFQIRFEAHNRTINWLTTRVRQLSGEIENLLSHYRRTTGKTSWWKSLQEKDQNE